MRRSTSRSRRISAQPESFLDCLRHFLTAHVWKQVQAAFRPYQASRWHPQPLIFVLLMMTWCAGDSSGERFETAKAFYVASYQKRRRPGKTLEGFHKALARVPTVLLRVLGKVVRRRVEHVFGDRLMVDGFIPLGCDGSRLACPRSAELEQRLGVSQRDGWYPQIWVTAVVHLSLGLLWSWRLGKGNASEREHLRQLLSTLPRSALLVADAGYGGYELMRDLAAARVSFLIRLTAGAPLYAEERIALSRFREGPAYYWPQKAQKKEQPPIPVRVLRFRSGKVEVWLMTNVFEAERLSHATAGTFYRWRWRNEGLFRTFKRNLGKVKLTSRTVALVHREAEGSLLALQLLLAQGSLAALLKGDTMLVLPSPRKILLTIRSEIRNVTGMYLGPRQKQTYLQRLQQARGEHRPPRRNKVRRCWPGRKDHQTPSPPKILKMGTDLKDLCRKTLGAA
jgi:Transposase DDE domain